MVGLEIKTISVVRSDEMISQQLALGSLFFGPRPQDAGTPSLLLLHFFIHLYSAIAVLATCPQTQGYRKEPTFPH
jgi:hypothetical protein